MPLRSQPVSTSVQVPTSLTVSAVAKPQTVSLSSPAHNPASPAMLQSVSSQSIKQVGLWVLRLFFSETEQPRAARCKLVRLFKTTGTAGGTVTSTGYIVDCSARPHPPCFHLVYL